MQPATRPFLCSIVKKVTPTTLRSKCVQNVDAKWNSFCSNQNSKKNVDANRAFEQRSVVIQGPIFGIVDEFEIMADKADDAHDFENETMSVENLTHYLLLSTKLS